MLLKNLYINLERRLIVFVFVFLYIFFSFVFIVVDGWNLIIYKNDKGLRRSKDINIRS